MNFTERSRTGWSSRFQGSMGKGRLRRVRVQDKEGRGKTQAPFMGKWRHNISQAQKDIDVPL